VTTGTRCGAHMSVSSFRLSPEQGHAAHLPLACDAHSLQVLCLCVCLRLLDHLQECSTEPMQKGQT
jgi:hypothetical protein